MTNTKTAVGSSGRVRVRGPRESDVDTIAAWLAKADNHRWLDFGGGRQSLDRITLKIMSRRNAHLLRVFTLESDDSPVGIVVLTDISRNFKKATLWYLLGDTRRAGKGCTSRAVSMILAEGFERLGLHSVNAWTVDANVASIRVLEHNNFQLIGRQRQCHFLGGRPHDRLLFDLLASEHIGILNA